MRKLPMIHYLMLANVLLFILPKVVNSSNADLANGAVHLEYGDDVTASIDAMGEIDSYTFNAFTGDKVIVRLRASSSSFKANLQLLSPNGTVLKSVAAAGGVARIDQVLTEDGTFSLAVKELDDNEIGSYGLSLEKIHPAPDVSILNCSHDLQASIDQMAEIDTYIFEGSADDYIVIQMNSAIPDFDVRMELYAPDSTLIELEIATGSLARIGLLKLPQNGAYTLATMEGGGDQTGVYSLSLQFLKSSCTQSISCGESLLQSIDSPTEIDAYTFEGKAGEQVLIRMNGNSSSFDPRLELYGPDGRLLETEVADGKLARIGAMTLPEDGTYTIFAMENGADETGSYELSIVSLQSNCSRTLNADEDLTGALTHTTDVDVYHFTAMAEDKVIIRLNGDSSSFDPRLELYGPDGTLLETENSKGAQARIGAINLPQSGTYTLLVMENEGDYQGSYGLSLQILRAEFTQLISCDQELTDSIEYLAEMDAYSFEATTGDQIILRLNHSSLDNFGSRMELYAPNGNLVEIELSTKAYARIETLTLTQTGKYLLLVMENEGDEIAEYGLALQVLKPSCAIPICDETLESTINQIAELKAYSLAGRAGASITIKLSELTASLVPRLELYAPDGSLLETDTDSTEAVIKLDLPVTGDYVILALDHRGTATGDYTIQLQGCLVDATEDLTNEQFNLISYPNPFSTTTNITFQLPQSAFTRLELFDVSGSKVGTLINGNLPSGQHKVEWKSNELSNGLYICKLQIGDQVISKKIFLLE